MRPLQFFALTTIGTALLLYAAPAGAALGGAQPSEIPMNSPQPQIPYGERVASNDFYDAYYDGHYGTFTDGYWGTDGGFWYQNGSASSNWVRDEGGHFRRTPAQGFALIRGTGVQREN
jgi:hypothetical protein